MIGDASDPHHILRTRIRLDRALYVDEDYIEIDIDPHADTDEFDELIEEFGWEQVDLAHHFLHRHRLYKMHVLKASDLDSFDLIAFMLIEEEQGLKQAEQATKLEDKTRT